MRFYSIKRTAFVFALNLGVAKVLNQLFGVPSNRIAVIPLAADSTLFAPNPSARRAVRTNLGFSEEDIVIVYTGRISRSKKIHLLIAAFAQVAKHNRHTELLIVGSGDVSYETELRDMCRSMNLSDRVVFAGSVHRKNLPQYFAASDMAVWPGAPSVSIIEAAAMGLPVILEHSQLTNHLITAGIGYSVEPNNVSDLTGRLEQLVIDDQVRLEMGANARKMVVARYEWSKVARKYQEVYLKASKQALVHTQD